jgi:hypothetical protein
VSHFQSPPRLSQDALRFLQRAAPEQVAEPVVFGMDVRSPAEPVFVFSENPGTFFDDFLLQEPALPSGLVGE